MDRVWRHKLNYTLIAKLLVPSNGRRIEKKPIVLAELSIIENEEELSAL